METLLEHYLFYVKWYFILSFMFTVAFGYLSGKALAEGRLDKTYSAIHGLMWPFIVVFALGAMIGLSGRK